MNDSCESVREQMAHWVTAGSPAQQAPDLERHTRQCRECREYLQGLQEDHRRLEGYAASLSPVVERLESNVMAALDDLPPATSQDVRTRWARIRGRRLPWAAAAAVLLGLGVLVFHSRSDHAVAKVVSGEVMVRAERSSEWHQRSKGRRIDPGDELRVGSGSAVVEISDGTVLTMCAGTRLILTGKKSDSRTSVYLNSGVVTAEVTHDSRPDGAFAIESSEGQARSLGTKFTVRMANNVFIDRRLAVTGMLPIAKRIMAVTVITGAVQLQADGQVAVVKAGSSGVAVRDEVPLVGPEAEVLVRTLLASSTVDGPMKPFLEAHDRYLEGFFEAIQANHLRRASIHANRISELWQAIGRMARARLTGSPQAQAQQRARKNLARVLADGGMQEPATSRQIDAIVAWEEQFKDPGWLGEFVHVLKQMEEYAEEIRDGARGDELGLSYVEHCLVGFIAYCEWFTRFPWDDPGKEMTLEEALAGVKRDLEIARREIRHPDNKKAERCVERCLEYAVQAAPLAKQRLANQAKGTDTRIETCQAMIERIEALLEAFQGARARSRQLRDGASQRGEPFRSALKEKLNAERSVQDAMLEEIEAALNLHATLLRKVVSEE